MADPVKKAEVSFGVREVTPMRSAAATTTTPLRAVDPFSETQRLFEGFFPRGRSRPSRWDLVNWPAAAELDAKVPRVDVMQRDAEMLVCAELPDVARGKLDISTADDNLYPKGDD